MSYKGIVQIIGQMAGSGDPGAPPKVVGASAMNSTTVRVTFDQEVVHVSPSNSNDALNPANYIFTTIGGVDITASSVSTVNPVTFDITTNEMTGGATYNVEVQSVENLVGAVINPAFDNQNFLGVSFPPRVSSATAITAYTLDVLFSEDMKNDAALTTPGNYTFTAGLLSSLATRQDARTVRVTVNEMQGSAPYVVTVANVRDLANNVVDPAHDDAAFSGIGDPPRLETGVTFETDYSFFIFYSEVVRPTEAQTKTNYTLLPSLNIAGVVKITGTKYRITTVNPQELGILYGLEVNNVHDLAGNNIDPLHNSLTFSGHVMTPPLLYIFPADGTIDLPPRSYVQQRAVDQRTGHLGIDRSTWQVRTTVSGSTVDVVADGVFNSVAFDGGISGDEMDPDVGVTVIFRPRRGYWDAGEVCSVYAQVADNEGANTNATWQLSFGAFECFEDNPLSVAEDSTILAEITRFPNCERLRQLFLACCSHSSQHVVQARTLLWYAASTGLRTLTSILFDPEIVDSVKLCNRMSTLEVQIALARDVATVRDALNELRTVLDSSILRIVEDSLHSADATNVVSAIATIVVLAAHT